MQDLALVCLDGLKKQNFGRNQDEGMFSCNPVIASPVAFIMCPVSFFLSFFFVLSDQLSAARGVGKITGKKRSPKGHECPWKRFAPIRPVSAEIFQPSPKR